jgi:hypothetical protein
MAQRENFMACINYPQTAVHRGFWRVYSPAEKNMTPLWEIQKVLAYDMLPWRRAVTPQKYDPSGKQA